MKLKDIHVDGLYPFSVSEDGSMIINLWTRRPIKPQVCKSGYSQVWSKGATDKRRGFMLHRLVALAWLDCPDGYKGMEINHKDGNKSNNHWSNLEWTTRLENMRHAHRSGLIAPSGKNQKTRKPERNAEIVAMRKSGKSYHAIGKALGISWVRARGVYLRETGEKVNARKRSL